jgi:hypothetical protein
MTPRVLIIVLCYNGIELTLACLASLRRQHYNNADILIVDNNSQDNTPSLVRTHFPEVSVIETGANLGFAAGNNVGLRYALNHDYDYALLLNNDTEVEPDFLTQLVAAAESDSTVGVVGPTIYYYEQPNRIWSTGGTLDWRRGTSAMRGLNEIDSGQYDSLVTVDFVSGCALLIKRTALEQVDLLDERFFMYYEETEWCVRIARAGFLIQHVPSSRIYHKIPLDARADKPYVAYYMTRNRLLFLRTTRATFLAWFHAVLLQDLRTCLSLTLRPKWRTKRPQRDAMLCGWNDFLRQHFGKWELS